MKEFALYNEDAEKGDIKAIFNVGWCYSNGFGVKRDLKKAQVYYQKAADKGLSEGWYNLGILYDKRAEFEINDEEAFRCFFESWRTGRCGRGNYMIGYYYKNGIAVTTDISNAFGFFVRAVKLGCCLGAEELGNCYENGLGVVQSFRYAFNLYEFSTNEGCFKAPYSLARCYKLGRGTCKSEFESINSLAKAKKLEFENPQNSAEAFIKAYQCHKIVVSAPGSISPIKENAESLFQQGLVFLKEKNHSEAINYLKTAARLKHGLASFQLGAIYWENKNFSDAIKYFYDASSFGCPDGHYMIAWIIRNSRGTLLEENLQEVLRLQECIGNNECRDAKNLLCDQSKILWTDESDLWSWDEKSSFVKSTISLEESNQKWLGWLEEGAKKGSLEAKYILAVYKMRKTSNRKTSTLFLEAAQQRHAPSLYKIGLCFLEENNLVNALDAFKYCCDNNVINKLSDQKILQVKEKIKQIEEAQQKGCNLM